MRRRLPPGWIPNYHGAWAMITIPVLLGVLIGGFVWQHVLLLGLWWAGYFAFYAGGLWLRSRRRPRYLPPVRAYTLVTFVFGVGLLIAAPLPTALAAPVHSTHCDDGVGLQPPQGPQPAQRRRDRHRRNPHPPRGL
ncbi:YwiC-like family protein [Trueperella pyogenes]